MPRWFIPGIGVLRPSIDRVAFVSSKSVGGLMTRLLKTRLKQTSHSLKFSRLPRRNARFASKVRLTCAGNWDPLLVLQANAHFLGRQSVTEVEFAYDLATTSMDDATAKQTMLVGLLSKRRHQRGFLWSVHEPDKAPSPGHVSAPTYYLEDRKSGVKIKCYVRHEKLAGGAFGVPLVVRLEWTLRRKAAVVRYLGGNLIKNILNLDLGQFLTDNLRLERVDYVAFGNLFRGIKKTARKTGTKQNAILSGATNIMKQRHDPDYLAERAAFLVLRALAYREHERGRFGSVDQPASLEQALATCQKSPAQIRGYLRELRDGGHPKRGRPKIMPRLNRRPITNHLINACFTPFRLRRARTPV